MQEIQWIPSRISKKKVIPRTITGKLRNKSRKQNQINKTTFEAVLEKERLASCSTIRMTDDLSTVAMEARR